MSPRKTPAKAAQRGEILTLPSGSLKVRVYAGKDPLTGKKNFLTETISHKLPDYRKEAERTRTRLLNQVDERRAPRTTATINMLMDRYEEHLKVDRSTEIGYRRNIRLHIRPLLGHLQLGKHLHGETWDSFNATLKQCSKHCGGKGKFIEHRKAGDHECTDKCKVHVCEGLSDSTIRKIYSCLSGAMKLALRWGWITVNPLDVATQPKAPKSKPNPPSTEEAALIVNEAFRDFSWGMLVWLTMVTGFRRGELCGVRIMDVDFAQRVLTVEVAVGQEGGQTWETDPKDHQKRRIALDEATWNLLLIYFEHIKSVAAEAGVALAPKGKLFSTAVDHSTPLKPDSVSQRYSRMCARLEIKTNLHALRHYSATELIAAGVDPRTVAGRLGHGGGGSTTLKVYSAWRSEADQRAAATLTGRMPTPPVALDPTGNIVSTLEPKISGPYQKIAADLRGAIACGALRPGDALPTVNELTARYDVSVGTANRAVAELKKEGLVEASRGKRAIVLDPSAANTHSADIVDLRQHQTAQGK
ncbi:tyrosine-type recombinase/integrase [Actinosynnema sp. NPDC023658]|uniref:tyrosine-type recombinase/integrase n=1 Tax=Actinosynnema sp. NPDC023658 TaxID=3155465 RepID=UPI003409FF52